MLTSHDFLKAARHTQHVDRRLFLAYSASLATLPWWGDQVEAAPDVKLGGNPFTLGVASGDPTPRGVVLWTRLAPEPLDPVGGMPAVAMNVGWEVAADEGFRQIVKRGRSLATPQLGHSVHVEVEGLEPNRWYYYRFRAGDAESPVGRTRTLPRRGAMPDELRFAFASCQHYEAGYYTAYRHMAEQELDLVIHLGDYIYEGKAGRGGVRQHVGKEIESLGDYRVRHALYKTDPDLQRMHARCPWLVTWDDHEFDNNCAGDISEERDVAPHEFLVRRANAYQAYYEAMPLRRRSFPQGPHMRLYRKVPFGRLADLMVLDTRQYRTDQPNGDKKCDFNDDCRHCDNTMLGVEQRDWLQRALLESPSKWNVLAQQVMMASVDVAAGEARAFSMDQWGGYLHERQQLMEFLAERRVPNPVVLTGDIHSNWVNDLRCDDLKPEQPVVATEFVGTSITSGANGDRVPKDHDTIRAENPCVQFYNRERGYVACHLTPGLWRSDYRVVDDVTTQHGNVTTRASFVVEEGIAGAKPA